MLFLVGVKSSGVVGCCCFLLALSLLELLNVAVFFVGVKSSGVVGNHLVASSGFIGPRHLQLLDHWLY